MRTLRRLVESVFGNVSWIPPFWLRAVGRWCNGHRWTTAVLLLLLTAIGGGGWWGYRYWQSLPKPRTVSVTAKAPSVTPLEEKLVFPPLKLLFDDSAAPLGQLDKKVETGIRIEPAVRGEWWWENDHRLVFWPQDDWPAATTYHITIDKKAVASHVILDRYAIDVTTPQFEAVFKKLEFYQDPTDPAMKRVVATLNFSHGVDPAELEKNVSLKMIGGSPVFKSGIPPFTIESGLHHRIAYVRSAPLILPDREDFMKAVVGKGLATAQGGAKLKEDVEEKVRIPDIDSFFRIDSIKGQIVRDKEGDPEQFLIVNTSAAAKPEDIAKGLEVYLLPKRDGDSESENKHWRTPREIDASAWQAVTPVPFTLVPSPQETAKLHTFKIKLETNGELYVKIRKGVRALGNFALGHDFDAVVPVPAPEQEVEIQGEGGVLALNGERKLSIKSRGIRMINYEIARVPADQINHLVSQTCGDFQNPGFVNFHFDQSNIARISTEKQTIAMANRFKANYSAFDFSSHLQPATDGGSPMQGLFFLKARAWDPEKDEEIEDVEAGRFILVTDIGILVKENADGSRDLFLESLKAKEPLGGIAVEILARNGVPSLTGTTGSDGHLFFPSLGKPEREKEPVAIVARNGTDVAFIPFKRNDRKLDFSRFDVGGIESVSGSELDAFVFTERGVYRPGDEIHVGYSVKQRNWGGKLAGLPIETEVTDARGLSVQVKTLTLPDGGFGEFSYQTAYESPTGDYNITVYLVRNGKRSTQLGSATVLVKEFLPDRMKIESHLMQQQDGKFEPPPSGWLDPKAVQASVSLRNLYGTPASDRRIVGRMVLCPGAFEFDEFKDYTFFNRLHPEKPEVGQETVELGEKKTGEDGGTQFALNLERFAGATYRMTFYAEGFEAEGGRSVTTQNSVLVSALPYVIGYKPDGDLNCLDMGSDHAVEFIAIDRTLKKTAVDAVLNLIEQSYVSVLTKQDDGTFAYESVKKERVIHTEPVSIPADGLKYLLPTQTPGNYVLELRENKSEAQLSRLTFCVVGHGAVSRSLDKNAELEVKLTRSQYNAGDEMEVSITAPYTGSGLITIERDKVYAYQWFKADTTASLQHIKLPDGFDGTGYVNVSFVRALDSKEIFMSPLSYGVTPFTANLERRRLKIDLNIPKLAKPGEPLHLRYKTDRPAKIVVYAVDQGILQVTNYELPDPLAYFFRKSALMVNTSQIVDLVLPEYSLLRRAAFGGDGEERQLNPFKRVTEKPVVFWSGIIDADTTEREVVYDVPDFFNGTLTVMAVAFTPDPTDTAVLLKPFLDNGSKPALALAAAGSVQQNTLVRAAFVITPSVPTLAAPGDQFEVGVTVANGLAGSGSTAQVNLTAIPSEHLQVVKAPPQPLIVPEGHEISATFSVRVTEKLGSASLEFHAISGTESSKLRSTLSVRPPVPLMTRVRSGNFTKEQIEIPIGEALHPEFRHLNAIVSAVPLGLAHGLDEYLKNYPNGCSEQLTSGAFCRLLVGDEADFALSRAEVFAQMEKTFSILCRRQNDQGAFGYWGPDAENGIDFISIYVMDFLSAAKEAGFNPPPDVFQAGLRNLQKMVALTPNSMGQARTLAYAIYVLTRQEVITTNYILNLRDFLDKNYPKQWQNDLTGIYLAGSLALLKDSDGAQKLIAAYKMGVHDLNDSNRWSDFHQPLGADSQYLTIIARHFPERLKKITAEQFQSIVGPISNGEFSTLTAAYAVQALKSYSRHLETTPVQLAMSEITQISGGQKTATELPATGKLIKRAPFSEKAVALQFSALPRIPGMGAFYQVSQTGFDLNLPDKPLSDSMEIFRELTDKNGERVDEANPARLGEPVTVRIRLRSLNHAMISNVAIMDLLPGGFEIVASSLHPGVNSNGCEYVDVREDRAVLFTNAEPEVRSISYQIKPCNRGEFVVPPVFAESMYDRKVKARGMGGKIRVIDAK